MTEKLHVQIAAQTGIPYVQVPSQSMWDLVEYLACNRTPVQYSYNSAGFTVHFLHLDPAAAQVLLDDWHAFESPYALASSAAS